jgi:hypothetical protein
MSNAHSRTVVARFVATLVVVAAGAAALPANAAVSWTTVANERSSFKVASSSTVRYGINSSWVTKTVSGRAPCTNDYFGTDPAYGIAKLCQVMSGTAAATTTPVTTTPVTTTPAKTTTPVVTTPVVATPVTTPVVTTPVATTPTTTTASVPAASTSDSSAATTTATMSSTTAEIANPERGFYGWGSDYLQNLSAGNLTYIRDTQGLRLTLGLIDLSAYKTSAIPQSFLDTLTAKFAMLRTAGVKVVIRAVYNYDSSGSDANIALIKSQAAQLGTVFTANADVIGHVQAGFIGAWGEWHDSASGNTSDANKASVRDAVLAMVPSTFPVEFRYPYDTIKWFPTALTASQAFNGSAQSRIGVHNDCFMSDNTDVGTYQSSALTNNPQREYTKAITEYAPYGGETCGGFSPARMGCSDILSEGAAYHLNYLNINYYTSFTDSWKSGGCYAQVMRSMGYRFQLDQVTHPASASRNSTISVAVDLRNVGWSRIFSPRKLVVTLRNTATGALITGTGTTDMRTLPSQASASTRATVSVAIPSGAAAGTYDVLVGMPDVYSTTSSNSYFAVRFANADTAAKGQAWETSVGRFDVGTSISVQ